MFSLHETTRIRLCRAAFVALCVLPTLALVSYSFWLRTAAHTAQHEQAISNQLGLRARLARVSYPRPGVVLYEHLDLVDPHSALLLARFPFVEVHTSATPLAIKLPYPATLNGDRLDSLGRSLVGRLCRFEGLGAIELTAANVSLRYSDGGQTFTDLRGQ